MDKILKLLGLPEGTIEADVIAHIELLIDERDDLKKEAAKLQEKLDAAAAIRAAGKNPREKAIIARMQKGSISREAAETAEDHQIAEDARREQKAKK